MNNRRLAFVAPLVVAGLIGSTGALAAEPIASSNMHQDRQETRESWGDPEQDEGTDRGWTWFGMGYEKRMQSTGAAAEASGIGSGGQAGQHNSRRK